MSIFDDLINKKKSTTFKPPIGRGELRTLSASFPITSRCYPEHLAMTYAIFKKKYPDSKIYTMSELVSTILEDYINEGHHHLDGRIPEAGEATDLLIELGFLNASNKRTYKALGRASKKSGEHEERLLNMSPAEQIAYWKDRDPDKAMDLILQEDARIDPDNIKAEELTPEQRASLDKIAGRGKNEG